MRSKSFRNYGQDQQIIHFLELQRTELALPLDQHGNIMILCGLFYSHIREFIIVDISFFTKAHTQRYTYIYFLGFSSFL